jgi:BirA family biotin operon repressor/biotin-[acetyl-CoA-carboxylase] ligase
LTTPIGYNPHEQARIRAAVARFPDWRVVFFPAVPSTQDACAELAAAGDREHLAVVASHQTEPRGTHGRRWSQAPGLDASTSILVEPRGRYPELLLPMLCAMALWRAARRFTRAPLRIKWPNDLLAGERKLAGVLIEGHPRQRWICGLGLNVNRREFPPELTDTATSLALLEDAHLERASVMAAILEATAELLDGAESGDLQPVERGFADGLGLLGRRVRISTTRGDDVTGQLTAVTADGLVLSDGRRFAAGDVRALS